MKEKSSIKFEDILLLTVIVLCFAFLFAAYITNKDATVRVQIITGILTILGIAVNWRFGSSKSSANKDETIRSLQQNSQPIKADIVNADNVETVNTTNTTVQQ